MARDDDPHAGRMENETGKPIANEPKASEPVMDEPIVRERELPGGGGIAADAGEYVLGTLDADERERFERRAETDPEARALAAFWRDRLGPLDAVAQPVAPSPAVWTAIEGALPDTPVLASNDNEVGRLKRSRGLWRALTLVAALALVGGAFLASNPELRGSVERRLGLPPLLPGGTDRPIVADGEAYLAVVSAEGKLPAMIVRVDAATGAVSVRSLAVPQPDGRSLEVWHVAQGEEAVSLGTLDGGLASSQAVLRPGDTLAVTEEARGGSPTGKATGPVVYSGQLVREPD